ncbi:uncharacterized protein LOC135706971 [Ochlerotatus camptorhynchus]|uniref:uncharacterized protein LOC135706971 n=1 Tax=Ochlerotatus camptorhynchus TaxID=644619 RepID=UPI0031D197AC
MSEGGNSSQGTPEVDASMLGCVACDRPNSADNFVSCDRCEGWWHMSCAGVTDSIEDCEWVCIKCLPVPAPSISVTSTSSARQARLQLELRRLTEMRELERMAMNVELERKFLERKYQMMEKSLQEEEDDLESARSHTIRQEDMKRAKDIEDWVEKQSADLEESGSIRSLSVKLMVKKLEKTKINPGSGTHSRKSPAVIGNSADIRVGTRIQLPPPPVSSGEQGSVDLGKRKELLQPPEDKPSDLTFEQIAALQDHLARCKMQLQPTASDPNPYGMLKPCEPDVSKGAVPKTCSKSVRPAKERLSLFITKPAPGNVNPEGNRETSTKRKEQNPRVILPEHLSPIKQRNATNAPQQQRAHAPQWITETEPRLLSSLARRPKETSQERNPTNPTSVHANIIPTIHDEQQLNEIDPVFVGSQRRTRARAAEPQNLREEGYDIGPTHQQLAARQVLPRDLPTFSGNPADWPVFISQYEYTTDACGYSDGENMVRLQRCLKGPAWESVRSRLILPASVPLVIQTLKMRYGRSELLIESLAERVRTAPSPKVDKLEMIIEFGTMVQALCDHIIAAHLYDHLANPTLLKDLVEKLPAEYRMRWAGHRRQQREVNLKTFSDFMEEIVSDAYSVSNVATTFERYSKQDRPKPRDRNLIHTEAGKVDCLVCKREGHRVKDCKIFSALPVDDRWKKVQSLQLCRTCLSNHGRRACRSTKRCEVDGCQYRHNPLLHASASKYKGQTSESHVQYHLNEASIPSLLFRILPITLHNGLKSVKRNWALPVPKLLIGVDNLRLALPLKTREGVTGGPTAVKTRLGWCVYGGQRTQEHPEYSYHICECGGEEAFDEALKKYFSFEEAGIKPTGAVMSEEDKRCARILETTTKRVGERFESGLLWKYDNFEFPDSYPMAVKRLQCLESRMAKDPSLKQNILRQIDEYQQKGYAHRATAEELAETDPRRTWYLPLGAVTNPNKPEKVRLIWDASAKVDGISLNSVLLKGPDMVTPLCFVVFRFRQYTVAVSADVKEMFHQVRTRGADRSAQSFLFRDDPSEEPQVFRMDVATFGATCSPAIAQYVKNANARSFEKELPRAVEGIVFNHYVDDYLDSFSTENKAKQVASEVREIHKRGGFEIRNWCSNSPTVLQHLGESQQHPVKQMCLDEKEQSERVLGMRWMTKSDELCFSATMRGDVASIIENGHKPTKRQILRCVMSLFDPLGFLAPYLVFGKVLIQSAWRLGIGWDEKVDDRLFEQWRKWTEMIDHINSVRIPRCYFRKTGATNLANVQLHTFVDAGRDACVCVSYLRVVNEDGEVEVALVSAKTKVVPLKPVTIPRLELQACVMGTRLAKYIIDGHSYSIKKRVFWSDSSAALSWIGADPHKYSPYIAYRVSEILEATDRTEWRWVASKDNPADEATKWGAGPYFNSNSIWYSGPEFLYLPERDWKRGDPEKSGEEELRACYVHREIHVPECIVDIERFSKWTHLQRVMAYVHRFTNNCRNVRLNTKVLTKKELKMAENSIFRLVQWQSFPDEIITLSTNRFLPSEQQRPLEKSSTIYQVTPMLDEFGVLRVNGRIAAAQCASTDAKYPIIIPRKHRLAALLVDHYHRQLKHGNKETTVNEIRQRFHIPKLRSFVNFVTARCNLCKIRKARPSIPQMAPLPQARLSPFTRPFSYVGLDYFGPFLVKVGRSKVKRWIALFTCLTIRAVHLEIASNLTTESCVACVRRFVCRRGFPVEIHSDNGTNFQGAERLLREQINTKLATTFTSSTTAWRFIPPGAPHMGGAWERMVRSVKTALTAAYNNEKLDDDALHTMIVEAESIVNSRPLTYLPLDSAEQEAITPNHFLLGSSAGVKQPVVQYEDNNALLKRSWAMIQERLNSFWKRWVREYLPTLTRRTKWFGSERNVAAGDLVIIIDDTRRNGWTRGRVLEAITAADGRVRQAIVQTNGGILRRPVSKLAVLDVAKEDGTKEAHWFHRGENDATKTDQLGARPRNRALKLRSPCVTVGLTVNDDKRNDEQ